MQSREPGRLPVDRHRGRPRAAGRADVREPPAKNFDKLAGWAQREEISCYRLYDADMPEYAFAIDSIPVSIRRDAGRWLYVQEYAPPATIDRDKARGAPRGGDLRDSRGRRAARDAIYWRTRRQQKGGAQYEKLAERGELVVVEEGGLELLVNFTDYLDTGLFLDHRPTRARIRARADGQEFLQSVLLHGRGDGVRGRGRRARDDERRHVAHLSRLGAAQPGVNGFAAMRHRFLQEDCIAWLAEDDGERYDLIFLDPPTFSHSKRMAARVRRAARPCRADPLDAERLEPGGLLLFSNNFRKFKLDADALKDLLIRDITKRTVPQDFARDPKTHHCFEICRAD